MKTLQTLVIGMILCASAAADLAIPLEEARNIKTYTSAEFEKQSAKLADNSIVCIEFVTRGPIYEDGTDFVMSYFEDQKHKAVSSRTPKGYRDWLTKLPEKGGSQKIVAYCRIIGAETTLKSVAVIGTSITFSLKDATIHGPKAGIFR